MNTASTNKPQPHSTKTVGTQLLIALAGVLLLACNPSVAQTANVPSDATQPAYWPQFHGPSRDNLSAGKGLLQRWPDGGPRLIWTAKGIGQGYASVAIVDDTIYTAGNIAGDTVVSALDMSGRIQWQVKNGPAYDRSFPGARATPTFDNGKLYHLNGDGDVVCLDAKTGQSVWSLNILAKFDGRNIRWGLSESLLIDGNNVICCPGGEEVSVAALHKDTGQTVWTCTGVDDKPGYTSPIVVDHDGTRQIVTMMSTSVVGVDADSGRLLWRHHHPVAFDVNIVTPVYHDGHIAVFGTWGCGATLLRLRVDGRDCSVERVWHTKDLDNEHGGVVLVDGYLYGHADGNHRNRHWACLDFHTGKTVYSADGPPGRRSGTLTYADGMLYLLGDQGTVALVPPNPDRFEITSRFQLPAGGKGPTWAHPVVCGGRLYIRHGDFLYAFDIRR